MEGKFRLPDKTLVWWDLVLCGFSFWKEGGSTYFHGVLTAQV